MTFWNTTSETGQTLATYRQSAMKQEDAVLALFRRHRGCFMSPSMVCAILNKQLGKNWPITSIRRAISDLTEMGLLEKTGSKVVSPLGWPEYRWHLADGLRSGEQVAS